MGIGLIIKGGDSFVDAAGWVSDVTGISRAIIGATIVSFATTSPEYFVSLLATLKGANDLSIGNAVGSLICNIGFAFALLAIFTPGKVHDRHFGIKGFIMIVSTVLLLIFCLNGIVSVVEGVVLLLIFVLFTYMNVRQSKDKAEMRKRKATNPKEVCINVLKFFGGAAFIVFGSDLIVNNGIVIASYMGVSETVIGLTMVAVGTALPELVTSVTAIIKKESALSIGNIIGANTLDATLILATGSFISKGSLTVPPATAGIDLPAALLLMTLAILPTIVGGKMYRIQGMAIAFLYLLYLAYIACTRI